MLGKLLLFLNRLRNPNREANPPSQPSKVDRGPEDVKEGNLISPEDIPVAVINRYYIFSIFVALIFVVLVSANYFIDKSLNSKKTEQIHLVYELNSLEKDSIQVQELDKKIKFYKNSVESRTSLIDKTALILDDIDPQLRLNNADVSFEEFKISLSGKNIYLFTKLIFRYLEKDYVSEVSIVSANFDTSSEDFTVELNGVFK